MPQPKVRILVADDEPDLRFVLKETLEHNGFSVETADDGDSALEAIRKSPPDIAILDVNMPRMNGFEACRALREDPVFEHLPVIFLSAAGTREKKVQGLELGADDYVTKPVDMVELLARVRMVVRRSRKGLDANPLTRLPGNVSIETQIEEALAENRPFAVLYLDLNQFKAYNDAYGYDAGDRVLKATGQLLLKIARDGKSGASFLGHIGGDDFIMISSPDRMEELAKKVIAEFDALAPTFYKEEDRKRGAMRAADRQGRVREFPLLSIAIGICHNLQRKLSSYAQVAQIGAELKSHAKRETRSSCVVDRRRD